MFYESIKLHFLPSLGRERMHITLTPAPVNVLVGPNGAGKSLALRELAGQSKDRKSICTRRVSRATLREAQEWRGSVDNGVRPQVAAVTSVGRRRAVGIYVEHCTLDSRPRASGYAAPAHGSGAGLVAFVVG